MAHLQKNKQAAFGTREASWNETLKVYSCVIESQPDRLEL